MARTSLHVAIRKGDAKAVESLLSKGAKVNEKEATHGKSPVYEAVHTQNTKILKLLIDAHADVNEKDDTGTSPLHLAISYGDDEIVKMLIQAGANVNAKNSLGETPLYEAMYSPIADVHKIKILKLLLDAKANVNKRFPNRKTPLHVAVSVLANEEILKMLIDAGANATIDKKDAKGDAPLHSAVTLQNTEIAQQLLDAGADVNVKNKEGFVALRYAIDLHNFDMVKTLIYKGADLDAHSSVYGLTALHFAVEENDVMVIEYLLWQGIDVDVKDSCERTPLHTASILNKGCSHLEVIRLLLDHGADLSARDAHGMTPSYYLERDSRGNAYVLEIIFNHADNANLEEYEEDKTSSDNVDDKLKEFVENSEIDKCSDITVTEENQNSDKNRDDKMDKWYELNQKIEKLIEDVDNRVSHLKTDVSRKAYLTGITHLLLVITIFYSFKFFSQQE